MISSARQRRPRGGAARGIADHAGEIANQKNYGVAEILKMLELAEQHGVAEMQIGRGGIDAQLSPAAACRTRATSPAWRASSDSLTISAEPFLM